MCEIAALAISKDCGKGGKRLYCFPPFPSGRHFHRGRVREFFFVVRPINLARSFLVSVLVTVGQDLGQALEILLRLHRSECMSQPLVLDDCRVTDTLILAEDAIGRQLTLPSHFKRPICEVIDLDILTCQAIR